MIPVARRMTTPAGRRRMLDDFRTWGMSTDDLVDHSSCEPGRYGARWGLRESEVMAALSLARVESRRSRARHA